MEQSFGLLFFIRNKADENKNEQPVYMRITVDGTRTEVSAKRKCEPSKWNPENGRMLGKSEAVKQFNAYLDTLQQKVFEAKRKLIETDQVISAEAIKNLLLG